VDDGKETPPAIKARFKQNVRPPGSA